jgi:phage-related protein
VARRTEKKAKQARSELKAVEQKQQQESELWDVETFQAADGSRPFDEFVENLPVEVRKRFFHRLSIIREEGLGTSRHILEKVENNLWAIRLPHSDGNPRFFCCVMIQHTFWLLHGFEKRGKPTDKIPESEKIIARRRRDEWMFQLEKYQVDQAKQPNKPRKNK